MFDLSRIKEVLVHLAGPLAYAHGWVMCGDSGFTVKRSSTRDCLYIMFHKVYADLDYYIQVEFAMHEVRQTEYSTNDLQLMAELWYDRINHELAEADEILQKKKGPGLSPGTLRLSLKEENLPPEWGEVCL